MKVYSLLFFFLYSLSASSGKRPPIKGVFSLQTLIDYGYVGRYKEIEAKRIEAKCFARALTDYAKKHPKKNFEESLEKNFLRLVSLVLERPQKEGNFFYKSIFERPLYLSSYEPVRYTLAHIADKIGIRDIQKDLKEYFISINDMQGEYWEIERRFIAWLFGFEALRVAEKPIDMEENKCISEAETILKELFSNPDEFIKSYISTKKNECFQKEKEEYQKQLLANEQTIPWRQLASSNSSKLKTAVYNSIKPEYDLRFRVWSEFLEYLNRAFSKDYGIETSFSASKEKVIEVQKECEEVCKKISLDDTLKISLLNLIEDWQKVLEAPVIFQKEVQRSCSLFRMNITSNADEKKIISKFEKAKKGLCAADQKIFDFLIYFLKIKFPDSSLPSLEQLEQAGKAVLEQMKAKKDFAKRDTESEKAKVENEAISSEKKNPSVSSDLPSHPDQQLTSPLSFVSLETSEKIRGERLPEVVPKPVGQRPDYRRIDTSALVRRMRTFDLKKVLYERFSQFKGKFTGWLSSLMKRVNAARLSGESKK